MDWPWGEQSPPRSAGSPLREAIAAAAILTATTPSDLTAPGPLRAAAARLAAAAEALGAPRERGGAPAPDTVLAVIAAQCESAPRLVVARPDALAAVDDAEVIGRLESAPDAFAARPSLPGRCPEAGSFARFWEAAPRAEGAFAARLAARLLDVVATLASLRLAIDGETNPDGVLTGGPAGDGFGYGAAEGARGRLYHLAETGKDGRIASYAVLAPTEWNFHPEGPYAAALAGARLGSGEPGRLMAARLAALVDPCVAFEVTLRD